MNRNKHDTDNENENILDLALDALARRDRGPLDGLDAATRDTVDQLFTWAEIGGLGSFDFPIATQSFPVVTSLVPANDPQRQHSRRTVPMDATRPHSTATRPENPSKPANRPTSRLWSAFAWAMIAATIGGSIYGAVPFFRDNRDTGPTTTAFQPDSATPDSIARSGDINYGGDAGRSWVVGQDTPTVNDIRSLSLLSDETSNLAGSPLLVGDSLLYPVFDAALQQVHFVRFDLVSEAIVWEVDVPMYGAFASDGRNIYGIVGLGANVTPEPVPTAISLETGEIVWEGPPLKQGSDAYGHGPIIAGETVYFTDNLGNTVALKTADGTVQWQYPETFADPIIYSDFDDTDGNPPQGDLVVAGGYLFVSMPSHTIVKLDLVTGEALDSFNVIDRYGSDIQGVTMQGTAHHLVVSARRSEKRSSPTGPLPYTPTSILIYDAGTLELTATAGLPNLFGNLVITGDAIYAEGQPNGNAPHQIFRIDLATGDLGAPLLDIDADATPALMSLAGELLMIDTVSGGFTFFDLAAGVAVPMGSDLTLEAGQPIMMWGSTPLTVSFTGELVLFGLALELP